MNNISTKVCCSSNYEISHLYAVWFEVEHNPADGDLLVTDIRDLLNDLFHLVSQLLRYLFAPDWHSPRVNLCPIEGGCSLISIILLIPVVSKVLSFG